MCSPYTHSWTHIESSNMSTLSFIILGILSASLAYYVIMLAVRIRNNVMTGISYHDALLSQLSELRMGRMMTALGINKERYVHQESGLDIDAQMRRCVACDNTAECDDRLAEDNVTPDSIDFCKNEAAFQSVSHKHNLSDDR